MKSKQTYVHIEGIRSLFFHRFNVDVLNAERKPKTGSVGNNPEKWRQTCFVTNENQLYLPGMYFFSCLKAGAAYTKVGRGTIQKKVAATL